MVVWNIVICRFINSRSGRAFCHISVIARDHVTTGCLVTHLLEDEALFSTPCFSLGELFRFFRGLVAPSVLPQLHPRWLVYVDRLHPALPHRDPASNTRHRCTSLLRWHMQRRPHTVALSTVRGAGMRR